ncbi:30S ribosomal protein S8 [Alphaproteobacteria bacterium]
MKHLADTLTRIRNAQAAQHGFVVVPFSKLVVDSMKVLKFEGYIKEYERFEERQGVNFVKIELKYSKDVPVISEIKMISKSSCRVYSKIGDLQKKRGGLGIKVLSTSKGVLSDDVARAENVGGEVLFEVF